MINSALKTTGDARPRKILIVDDDRDFSVGMADLLSLEGFAVELSCNRKAAEETLKNFPAEIVIVDLRLGGACGIDLIAALHKKHPQILCVMMTAHADIETAVTALRQGAYDYLRKPFHAEELLATIDRCIEHIDVVQEKMHAEEALRRSQKMEAIGELSGGIAHDFNNQLGVIIGHLDFLQAHTNNDEKLNKWVSTATRATLRCIDLTRQLLAFSRSRSEKKNHSKP